MDKNTARVIVHEKRITGCVLIMGRYMYFDKDGIVVESSIERIEGIPMVTGLEFKEIALYKKLQIQKQGLYDTILQLTRLIEKNEIEGLPRSKYIDVKSYMNDLEILDSITQTKIKSINKNAPKELIKIVTINSSFSIMKRINKEVSIAN